MLMPQDYAWPGETVLRRILAVERADLVEICDKFWLAYLPSVLRRGWVGGVSVTAFVAPAFGGVGDGVGFFINSRKAARVLRQTEYAQGVRPAIRFYIAVSDYTAAELRRALPGRKQDRLYVEPMGVDYERFSKRGRRAQWRAELVSMLGGDERTVFASLRRTAGERKK